MGRTCALVLAFAVCLVSGCAAPGLFEGAVQEVRENMAPIKSSHTDPFSHDSMMADLP